MSPAPCHATAAALAGLSAAGNRATLSCRACSPPAITLATSPAVTHTTAGVSIKPPLTAPSSGGWDKYELTVCPVDPAAPCFTRNCTSLSSSPAPTACALTSLRAGTQYSVQVRNRTAADWETRLAGMLHGPDLGSACDASRLVQAVAVKGASNPIKSAPTEPDASFTTLTFPWVQPDQPLCRALGWSLPSAPAGGARHLACHTRRARLPLAVLLP